MENVHTRPLSKIEGPAWRRTLPQALVLVVLLVGMAVYAAVPFLELNWVRAPFVGAFLEPGMVMNAVHPAGSRVFTRVLAGSQLLAVDNAPVNTSADLQAALVSHAVGDAVTLHARNPLGQAYDLPAKLVTFPNGALLTFFIFPYFLGLVYLAVGVWVFSIRRGHVSGRVFALFSVAAALSLGLWFDRFTTHLLTPLWWGAMLLLGWSAFRLALVFPRDDVRLLHMRRLNNLVMITALALGVYALGSYFVISAGMNRAVEHWIIANQLIAFYAAAGLAFLVVRAYQRFRRIKFPNDREQLRLVWISGLVSFLPLAGWFAVRLVRPGIGFLPYVLLTLPLFPLVIGYTVQRYRMVQADLVLSLGLRYGLLSVLTVLGYALATAGVTLAFARWLAPNNLILTGMMFFVFALAFAPLREGLQRLVDAAFFRGRRVFQDRLQTFSGDLTRQVDLPGILDVLRRYAEEVLTPTQLHAFIYDTFSDQYSAAADASGRPTSDLRFSMISGLVIRMAEQHNPLVINEYDDLPPMLEPDRPRLILLGAQVFVPLPGRSRLSGWLALGPRLSGEPYTSMQLGFAEALCDQAALAIERAQVVANMEHRVREMNVLTRVAQGINITLVLDDILELVYAQTAQIIPTQHFAIMLYNKELDTYQYAFYLENNDRLSENENSVVAVGQALEQEIIRQRRAILSADYGQECLRRGIAAGTTRRYAWLGVPLNAGAETIGALSLSSLDPAVEYTAEQQALLQAIADQVAGAMVKARLLEETERRARQLATLNDVTRQLTSTLEPEPLLQSILQAAVNILNCEAGSLLMVDEATDELVFHSVISPVESQLLGTRMPSDRGIAGQSVRQGLPIIVNDVTKYPEWFSNTDKSTGFVTRNVLVIPMKRKEHVTGVIEVINKRGGAIFSVDDQEIISAFASQAMVAMENARLYTLTDQALAARVEELSVMQRIDRELNASLDPSTAMRITLEWAMRQSGAQAGLVGVTFEEDTSGLRVMASQGYKNELDAYQEQALPTAQYTLETAILDGQPLRRITGENGDAPALLIGGQRQAIIPIRREAHTIGLLLLEGTHEGLTRDETLGFLVRLSDHASIAIANAQLYAAVQQANLAKSDFVSFVAHELKNPMTSVKGYTELIAAGAVGPITEPQANFLGTIRANIERMNTLVSDLNDMSKIEVGRLRLDFKAVRLADSVETVIRSTRKQIEEKQQVLNVAIPADLPPVWADRIRFEQVLVNLVSNAHKYTLQGGTIEVAAERCPNQWDANGAAEVVHVWVKDSGIGISEEDQQKIFQKFFRSDDPRTREVTGTGLGLNITKSLVEMQGGHIWFESVFREGTTFHVTIPVSA